METRSNNVLVGGVVLGLLTALILFIVWISGINDGRQKEYDIFFAQSVEGLNKGGVVTYAGVPSGEVKKIELWKRNPGFVRVRIAVDEETPVLIGTQASLQGSFTGPSSILLEGAKQGAPAIVEEGPTGVPVIPTKTTGLGALLTSAPKLMEQLSTLSGRITELLNDDNQNSVGNILRNAEAFSSTMARNGPQIDAMLRDTRVAIQQAGRAADQLARMGETGNQILAGDGRAMIADLRSAAAQAKSSMAAVDAAIGEARPGLQAFSTQTVPELSQLVRDLRVMSESLGNVATRLDQGGVGGILGGPKLPDYKPGKGN